MHTERVTYLSTADQKAALEAFAKSRGESVGNVVREATARYIAQPPEVRDDEEAELAALVAQVNEAMPRMRESLEEMSKKVRDVNADIGAFLREKGIRK
jgi:molybdopterin converting factor small subunit